MPGPIFGLKFVHTAFRNDLQRSRAEIQFWATLADGDPDAIHNRFAAIHEFLALHELAEEEVLFPAANALEAGKADVYVQAHRNIDPLRDSILQACKAHNADKAFDGIMELVPAMTAHLDQEEGELWPWLDEKIAPPDQGKILREMAGKIPPDKFMAMVPWMMRNLNADDRETIMRVWSAALPAPAFEGVKGAAKGALREPEWEDLAGRMPELA